MRHNTLEVAVWRTEVAKYNVPFTEFAGLMMSSAPIARNKNADRRVHKPGSAWRFGCSVLPEASLLSAGHNRARGVMLRRAQVDGARRRMTLRNAAGGVFLKQSAACAAYAPYASRIASR